MYAALNQKRQLIYALDGQFGEAYFCPQCWQPVQLMLSNEKHRAYFRHYVKHQDFVGESALHVRGKLALQETLLKMGQVAEQEVILGDEERRADVLWHFHGTKYAFEFQCASLSLAELTTRHASYQRLKISDIWLIGSPYLHQNQRKIHRTALKFVAYRARWGYFVAAWLPEIATVRLFHHLAFCPPQRTVTATYVDYNLGTFLNAYLRQRDYLIALPQIPLSFDPSTWLSRQLKYQQPRWLKLQTSCYERGMMLQELPQELWLPQRLPPLSRNWGLILNRQITFYLANGELTWQQRSQIYLETKWPLVN